MRTSPPIAQISEVLSNKMTEYSFEVTEKTKQLGQSATERMTSVAQVAQQTAGQAYHKVHETVSSLSSRTKGAISNMPERISQLRKLMRQYPITATFAVSFFMLMSIPLSVFMAFCVVTFCLTFFTFVAVQGSFLLIGSGVLSLFVMGAAFVAFWISLFLIGTFYSGRLLSQLLSVAMSKSSSMRANSYLDPIDSGSPAPASR